jgi:hypothetical protein
MTISMRADRWSREVVKRIFGAALVDPTFYDIVHRVCGFSKGGVIRITRSFELEAMKNCMLRLIVVINGMGILNAKTNFSEGVSYCKTMGTFLSR